MICSMRREGEEGGGRWGVFSERGKEVGSAC